MPGDKRRNRGGGGSRVEKRPGDKRRNRGGGSRVEKGLEIRDGTGGVG